MKKFQIFLKNHNYAFILFFCTALYYILFIGVGNPLSFTMSSDTYVFYLTDFSMGFCTKFLQGAIYNFFFDDFSIEAVSIFNIILFFLFLSIIIILFDILIKQLEKPYKAAFMFLIVLFLTGPSSLPMHYYKLGSMDSYWLYFAILSVLFLSNKYLYCFIIPISFLSVLINYGSILNFIPFIVILMIYKSAVISDKTEKIFLRIIISVTILVSIGSAFYFVAFEKDNLTYNVNEFTSIMKNRGFTSELFYYKSTLYNVSYSQPIDYDYINSFSSPVQRAFVFIWHRMLYTLEFISFSSFFKMSLCVLVPVIILFTYFIKRIKAELQSNRIKAFSYLCCLGMFFITIATGFLVSTDVIRFYAHACTLLFASFFFIAYYEKDAAVSFIKNAFSVIPEPAFLIYSVFYVFSFFDPVG